MFVLLCVASYSIMSKLFYHTKYKMHILYFPPNKYWRFLHYLKVISRSMGHRICQNLGNSQLVGSDFYWGCSQGLIVCILFYKIRYGNTQTACISLQREGLEPINVSAPQKSIGDEA